MNKRNEPSDRHSFLGPIFKKFSAFDESAVKGLLRCAYCDLTQNDYTVRYDGTYSFKIQMAQRAIRFRMCTMTIQHPISDISLSLRGYLGRWGIKQGDVVVDAGAFHGAFTLISSMLVGENGRVISFEPDSVNYRMLQRNVELNDLRNVTIVNKGIWSKEGELDFNASHSETSSFVFSLTEDSNVVRVPVVSLDHELTRLGVDNLDFVKMDIEGAEIEAIRGASVCLQKSRPILAIASYHNVGGKETYHEVEGLLSSLGYHCDTAFPIHRITYAKRNGCQKST